MWGETTWHVQFAEDVSILQLDSHRFGSVLQPWFVSSQQTELAIQWLDELNHLSHTYIPGETWVAYATEDGRTGNIAQIAGMYMPSGLDGRGGLERDARRGHRGGLTA